MAGARIQLDDGSTHVVGSIGGAGDLCGLATDEVRDSCDLVEIRLDLLMAETGGIDPSKWSLLTDFPLLFTARRADEGGAGSLEAATRAAMLMEILDHAAMIDIEVASIGEMAPLLEVLRGRRIPWIASYHDFSKLPDANILREAENLAVEAGASVFKAAAMLGSPRDLATLAEFQLASHAIPVSTMGMGSLAPVSRLLCAQAGSVLNYGYLGNTATAPGQWDCGLLKTAIRRLRPIRS